MGIVGSTKSSPGWFKGLSDAPKSSTRPARICHLVKSGTIWLGMLPMPWYGELFLEMVLWPPPKSISGAFGPRNRHSRELCCTGCAAGATVHGLWCMGLCCRSYAARVYAAGTMLHAPCCKGYHADYADQHAPSVAIATQITMLHLMHWPQGSACST